MNIRPCPLRRGEQWSRRSIIGLSYCLLFTDYCSLIVVAAGLLLCGCSSSPDVRAKRELKAVVAGRRAVEAASAKEKSALEERMIRSGEAERISKWAGRLSGQLAESELTSERARRTAVLETEDRMLARGESIEQREARLAVRARLRELHGELVALRTAAQQEGTGAKAAGARYGVDHEQLLEEIENLSRERARIDYLRRRAADSKLCRRALDAALAAEKADASGRSAGTP